MQNNKRLFDPVEEHRHWCGWIVERRLSPDLSDIYYEDLRGFRVLTSQIKAYLRPKVPSHITSAFKSVSLIAINLWYIIHNNKNVIQRIINNPLDIIKVHKQIYTYFLA